MIFFSRYFSAAILHSRFHSPFTFPSMTARHVDAHTITGHRLMMPRAFCDAFQRNYRPLSSNEELPVTSVPTSHATRRRSIQMPPPLPGLRLDIIFKQHTSVVPRDIFARKPRDYFHLLYLADATSMIIVFDDDAHFPCLACALRQAYTEPHLL